MRETEKKKRAGWRAERDSGKEQIGVGKECLFMVGVLVF